MKNLLTALCVLSIVSVNAQIGVGTTTPNSTLDVRGSLSLNYRSFTAATTATISDYILNFTGTTAITVTLPTAATCAGRVYVIKNSSTSATTPVLTVATTSSQTIDGSTTWTLDVAKDILTVMSNGANWEVIVGNSTANKDDLAIGNVYFNGTTNTTFTGANISKKLTAVTSSGNLYRVTSPADNRLTYTGTRTRRFQVIAAVSGTQTSGDISYTFHIAKNGVLLTESRQSTYFVVAQQKVNISLSCIVSLAPNDYVEVWIENDTNTTAFNTSNLNLSIK